MTLAEAHAALKAALPPGANRSIRMEVSDYYANPGLTVRYSVWDGRSFHESKTLAGAVMLCVEAHRPPPLAPLAEAEAVLADVQVVESAA